MLRQGIARGAWFVTLAPVLISGATIMAGLRGEGSGADGVRADAGAPAVDAAARSAVRIHCAAPSTLHLRRFEDRSAQLLCRNRVIVRISVPR